MNKEEAINKLDELIAEAEELINKYPNDEVLQIQLETLESLRDELLNE